MAYDIIIIADVLGTYRHVKAFNLEVFYHIVCIAFLVGLIVVGRLDLPDYGKPLYESGESYGISDIRFYMLLCGFIILGSRPDHIAFIVPVSDEDRGDDAGGGR